MHQQIDRCGDGGSAVALFGPDGSKGLEAPHAGFPWDAAAGVVIGVSLGQGAEVTEREARKNRRLLVGLSGGHR